VPVPVNWRMARERPRGSTKRCFHIMGAVATADTDRFITQNGFCRANHPEAASSPLALDRTWPVAVKASDGSITTKLPQRVTTKFNRRRVRDCHSPENLP